MNFEIEAENIAEAREKIMTLKREFGEDNLITIRFVSGSKDKLLNTLDDGAKKLFEDAKKLLAKKMEAE